MYFLQKNSLYEATRGDLKQELTTMVQRYLGANPVQKVNYRISNTNGFQRNKNFRYVLDFMVKLPQMEIDEWTYAWAKIPISESKEYQFYVDPYGPTTIYINNQRQYKSSLISENSKCDPGFFSYFAEEGFLSVLIECKRTKTGCGCEFGSVQVKSNPFYVLCPTKERQSEEGWIYTLPKKNRLKVDWILDQEEMSYEQSFLPKLDWSINKKKDSLLHRLGATQKQKFYAIVTGHFFHEGEYVFWLNDPAAKIFIEDKEFSTGEKVELKVGNKRIIVELKNNKIEQLSLEIKDSFGRLVDLSSSFSEDVKTTFAFIGPFPTEQSFAYEDLCDLSRIHENHYWRLDAPYRVLRACLETPLFGKWNYPLGVTLRGLLDYAVLFKNEGVFSYVKEHIELCTSYFEYARWDTLEYGAPMINNNISLIDSLDDCGSFARTLLEILKYTPIRSSEQVLSVIADYITKKQYRRENGALYRSHGHTKLMEDTLWADDTYMSVPFLVEYGNYVQKKEYFADAQKQMKLFHEYLWMPQKKLFGHVYDFKFHENTDIPWGRGNGWYLFSLTDVLKNLTKKDENHAYFLKIYNEQIAGLLAVNGPHKMWHQILDDPDSYEETSCTLIIIYSLLQGIENNWLDPLLQKDVQQLVNASWEYLSMNMLDKYGNLYGVCRGSGYSFDRDYYKYDLLPNINDTHGVGIALMAGCKILGLINREEEK